MLKRRVISTGLVLFFLVLSIQANTPIPNDRLTELTNERLKMVHPELRKKFRTIKQYMEKYFPQYRIQIIKTYRTCEEQEKEWRKGRDKTGKIDNDPKTKVVTYARCGQSYHNFFLALDLAPFRDGKPVWEDWKFWKKLSEVVISLQLQSGGNFKKLKDYTHIELTTEFARVKKICGNKGCEPQDKIAVFKIKSPDSKQSRQQNLADNKKVTSKNKQRKPNEASRVRQTGIN